MQSTDNSLKYHMTQLAFLSMTHGGEMSQAEVNSGDMENTDQDQWMAAADSRITDIPRDASILDHWAQTLFSLLPSWLHYILNHQTPNLYSTWTKLSASPRSACRTREAVFSSRIQQHLLERVPPPAETVWYPGAHAVKHYLLHTQDEIGAVWRFMNS